MSTINPMRAVALVVALTVGGLITAFVLPIGISSINDDQVTTMNQSVSDGFEPIGNGFSSDVTEVNAGMNATYNVSFDGSYQTVTVTEGTSETVTVGGEPITLQLTEAGSDYAVTEYTHDKTAGWSDGSAALWGVLDVILVLAVFLFFVSVALSATSKI